MKPKGETTSALRGARIDSDALMRSDMPEPGFGSPGAAYRACRRVSAVLAIGGRRRRSRPRP